MQDACRRKASTGAAGLVLANSGHAESVFVRREHPGCRRGIALPRRARAMGRAVALALILPAGAAEVAIDGVERELERNVRAYLAIAKEPCTAEPGRFERALASVQDDVAKALQPFGYYDATVDVELTGSAECRAATLRIDPGEPVVLRALDVSMTDAMGASLDLFPPDPPSVGEPLRHAAYDAYKGAMLTAVARRGYLDARFATSRLDIWPNELAADVTLHLEAGRRYSVGPISAPEGALNPSLLHGYLGLETGTPYSAELVALAQRSLTDSGYFERVAVVPDFAGTTKNEVPLRLELEPAARVEWTAGAGFATDTGARIKAGYRNRRVNPRGHRLLSDLTASSVLSGWHTEYRLPTGDPRTDSMSYAVDVSRERTATSDNDAIRAAMRRTTRVGRAWVRTWSVEWSHERFVVGAVADTSRLLQVAFALDRKSATAALYPNRGHRVRLEARLAHAGFAQVGARLRWIRALAGGRLLARATLGATIGSGIGRLPPSLRYFAGGDESVRGFGYEALGPQDAVGRVIGGTRLATASLEYERRLRGDWYGAVFADAGNAFSGARLKAAASTGVGIKWRSVAGPVALYVAHPLRRSAQVLRVHLTFGLEL